MVGNKQQLIAEKLSTYIGGQNYSCGIENYPGENDKTLDIYGHAVAHIISNSSIIEDYTINIQCDVGWGVNMQGLQSNFETEIKKISGLENAVITVNGV